MEKKRIVVVLGMHRSGTSAITRGLQVLGVELGSQLLSAETGNNEKGFWEDIDITAFDVDLLAALDHDWHTLTPIQAPELNTPAIEPLKLRAAQLIRSKLINIDVFGLKDPRMSRLMPFWLEVFEHLQLDVSYVIACRNPMNVVHSLAKRNNFSFEKSYLLWFEHMLLSMKYTEHARRVFVDYDLILSDPEHQLERISKELDLTFSVDSNAFSQYRSDFLETSLRHNEYAPEDLHLDPAATAEVKKLHSVIIDLVNDRIKDGTGINELVENLHKSLLGRYSEYRLMRALEDQRDDLDRRLEQAEMIAANLAEQANEARTALLAQANEAEATLAIQQSKHDQQLEGLHAQRDSDVQRLKHALLTARTGRTALKNLVKAIARHIGLGYLQKLYALSKLNNSGLFDAKYYLTTYADVAQAGVDATAHFLDHGWREGRDPSAFFSTKGYLERYLDVQTLDINPLLHYLKSGYREGRMVPAVMSGESSRLEPHRPVSELAFRFLHIMISEPLLVGKFIREARRAGFAHALALVRSKANRPGTIAPSSSLAAKQLDLRLEEYSRYNVVPFYLNPYQDTEQLIPPLKIGIHLHLFYEDLAQECISYLDNIPLPFDLYLSIPEHADKKSREEEFKSKLSMVRQVIVASVPNRGRDLAPLIIEFGTQLTSYDVIAHFHTKKSPHKESLKGWFNALMDSLCGSRHGVSQILDLLSADAKIVYPAGQQRAHWDISGWSDNQKIAKSLLEKYSDLDISEFQNIEFPQGSMFWGKSSALQKILALPLNYDDFAEEPIPADATLAHALERLILVFSTEHAGRNYRIESRELSAEPQEFYEEQFDFSERITHNSIKVLAYYLPQFHPTPENDLWHGKGFTEWHKVRSANPLFHGHYQQHIPHPDIGYYHLSSPTQLALQADMMDKAGVHGLIFYHYWFSGKLILEKPAKMLLDNPAIKIPFSFCWANENWTRRWDGNENEILLGQVYSPEDAVDFIRYLVPFFKDDRYIKVDGRPVLFIYRPSAMEHVGDYLRIWREECQLNGIQPPYIIATMTRGAVSPSHYGMDAAVERPLHDWTAGAVSDIRNQLSQYCTMNGSVLDYGEVADHYMHKEADKDYVQFRSLVPTWDNTARYGSEAILLHRFTTSKFQEWLEHLIRHAVNTLPEDRRFIVVNAWNEWAEGAHLEPDTRFGYGYLNSIGRALCNYSFNDTHYLSSQVSVNKILRLELTDEVKHQLIVDNTAKRKFLHCLSSSTIFRKCTVIIDEPDLATELVALGIRPASSEVTEPDFILSFDRLYLFSCACLESLLLTALRHPGFSISPGVLNDPKHSTTSFTANLNTDYWNRAGMAVTPGKTPLKGYKIACNTACLCIPKSSKELSEDQLPQITTIMRFHRTGSLNVLANALLSLVAQSDCRVRLYLAVQDINDQDLIHLDAELARIPWSEGCKPIIRRYYSSESNPDLRSLMLNETLKSVGKGYAAFLDYDDVLFPHAYHYLLKRLQLSGKNASFARVYATRVDANTGTVLKRDKTYEYGFSYEEFIKLNHAPLHSFMLNLDKIDLRDVHYHEDMKFMEDYYLTLQLFTKAGTDWESLRIGEFIGDYVHRVGGASNTLALHNEDERKTLLQSKHYVLCEARINELRKKLPFK